MEQVDEEDIWDGGEDPHVAAYRNFIVDIEREIEEQSGESSNDQDKGGLLAPRVSKKPDINPRLGTPPLERTPELHPRFGTPPPPNGVLKSNGVQGGDRIVSPVPNSNRVSSPVNRVSSPVNRVSSPVDRIGSPVNNNTRKTSPTRSVHTPLGSQDGSLTPVSPRSYSPMRTPSPVGDDTTLLFAKAPRSRKCPVVVEPVLCDSMGNGKVLMDDVDSVKKAKLVDVESELPRSRVRSFKQRSAQENFCLYGLLTPALCLVPGVDGHDALTQTFTDLCGEHRELKLAAAHIDDAINGRGKWGKARAFFTSKKGQLCFKVLDNSWFTYVVLLAALLHMIMTFLEPPPVGQMNYVVFALTIISLLVYAIDVSVHIGFLSWRVFWSLDENKWIRMEFIFLCMFTIDFVMLVIQEIVQIRLIQPFRCLRAFIIICKLKNVGHIFDTVLSIVIKLIKTFFIILVFIVMFSAMGVHLFSDSYHFIGCNSSAPTNCVDNEPFSVYTGAFDNVGITALRLFVLLSTENYPEFMVPAFQQNGVSFLYFGIFIFVGVFFLTAILLAIIVDSYWEFAKKHVKQERARERAELAKAWNLMDPLGKGSLPIYDEKFIKLFKILKPMNTDEMNMQLISYLDSNQDEVVDSLEWTIRLNEALSFEFEMDEIQDVSSSSKWCINMKHMAQRLVFSDMFSRFVMVLIVTYCILFCLEWRGISHTARLIIGIGKSIIIGIFVVEACLRVFSDWRILKEAIEVFDIILIVIALIANILWYASDSYQQLFDVIGGLVVTLRIGLNSAQTKKAVLLFLTKIFPVMFDLIILVSAIMFLYAIIGFEIFYDQEPNESYSSGHYEYQCKLGFKNVWCSLLMVFQIITTSNWHEIMNSAMVSTSDWACLYFILGFIFINLIVMNLFVAIAIEAFNKLGTEKELAEEQDPDQEPKKEEDPNFKESAKAFLNNIFESTRVEQGKDRTERSARPPGGSPRMRRPSRVSVVGGFGPLPSQAHSQTSLRTPEPQEDEENDEEDYSGLTPQERKRKQLKKKMMNKKKKKPPKTKIVVVTAYRGTKDQELDLNVGDEVTVLKKQDDWWEGQIKDNVGWFPASHVEEVKRSAAVHFQEPGADGPMPDSPKPAWNTGTLGSLDGGLDATLPNAPLNNSMKPVGLGQLASVVTAAKHKPRLKVRNTGSWRKEILGDITVMNPEELKELNKILKGQSGRGSLTNSLTLGGSLPLRKAPTLMADNIIEEEPDIEVPLPRPILHTKPSELKASRPKASGPKASERKLVPPRVVPPKISLERADTLPELPEIQEEEDETSSNKVTLTVEKPDAPPNVKKKKTKEKTKNGEMPSWMLKFAQDNKLNVLSDVKFDEPPKEASHSGSDEESQSIPGKVQQEQDSKV
ncbi:uncharacterized protein LOC117290662 [Asterias rubens]|uniref:uncharacterized protein LOC117290662 n=1 Tax=Asterias rubens TaxID=7604 RepID=UPI0014559482|nr:uncharacterized protein LOC117290662 [Asterias rubens]